MDAAKKLKKNKVLQLKISLKILTERMSKEEVNVNDVQAGFERAEKAFALTEEAFQNLLDMEEDEENMEKINTEIFELASQYHGLKDRAKTLLTPDPPESQSSTSQNNGGDNGHQARLPTIHIEPFEGDFTKWKQFEDVYTALVHSKNNLTGAEKLQILKNCLRGKAAKVISNFSVTNANYDEAWDMLQTRFNNKRLIVENLFSQLLEIKKISSSAGLSDLVNTVDGVHRSLQKLEIENYFDAFLCHFVSTRLDCTTAKAWEDIQTKEVPKLSAMMNFLEGKLDHKEIPEDKPPQPLQQFKQQMPCPACKQQHKAWACDAFRQASVSERWNLAKAARICINCLQGGHNSTVCRLSGCKYCGEKHHSLLHNERRYSSFKEKVNSDDCKPSTPKTVATSIMMGEDTRPSLLGTANVYILDVNGHPIKVRALLDQGSQTNLLTRQCLRKLKLPEQSATTTVQCIGNSAPQGALSKVNITVKNSSGDFNYQGCALIMDKIMENQPQQSIVKPTKFIKGLDLADDNFDKPGPIEALLGVDIYMKACRKGLKHPKGNGPGAQNTAFGWVLMGSLTSGMINSKKNNGAPYVNALTTQANDLWALQAVPSVPVRTEEDKACEQSYQLNTLRQPDGRYIVRIPFCNVPPELGDSRMQAIKRQLNLEKRFRIYEEFAAEYKKAMKDLLNKGHMKKAEPSTSSSTPVYYIPHHAVTKLSSQSTKLRVVFDASAKSTNGKSLNDNMYTGPRLQEDLVHILLRFRIHRVVITGDIEKMYRMINLHEEDQPLHRIIWRNSEDMPLEDYQLTTVSFGVKAAPFLAIRTLQQLGADEKHRFPDAVKVLLRDFYVDDLLSGTETPEQAATLVQQLIQLLKAGGFHLTKWASNSEKALQYVPEEDKSLSPVQVFDESGIKTLGLQWMPYLDKFHFCYQKPKHSKLTKRNILSDIGKLFDPLGWLLPATIRGRIIFQSLWRENIEWDTPIPSTFAEQWASYLEDMQNVNKIAIERCIKGQDNGTYTLFGFCDSSESAYGACVYLRTQSVNGIKAHLIAAKARVATLHSTTLPRLELCGALELALLIESVETALRLPITAVHAFTDSSITLQWIKNLNIRWKPFVANRVSAIHNAVPHAIWHHIPGKDNIADIISRGISAHDLASCQEWWTGPPILYEPLLKNDEIFPPNEEARREARATTICTITVSTPDENFINRFSDLNRLLRVTAWIRRFVAKMRKTQTDSQQCISSAELEFSRNTWIKQAQQDAYPTMFRGGMIPQTLQSLNPFLDGNNIIRVGGRLRNAEVSIDQKQPIMLPRKARITRLIVENAHKETLHGGPQLMITTLRQQYWITNMKDLVKQVSRQCGKCSRLRAKTCIQLMGDLPRARVTAARPFQRTGVDYMGPFWMKTRAGRGAKRYKGYVAIFICFTTRAIHLEYVGDLTTAAFLGALRRFIARRGKPSDIFSDSGTNLVGGNNELKNYLEIANNENRLSHIGDHLSQMGIAWHFNPAAAPHFGGLWEAGVKSTKYHLKRIIGDTALTTEELETVLCQVEAVLNSRPLVDLSDDPSDLQALTPGHFLIGGPLIAHPEPNFREYKESHLTRWTRLQQMVQHFWRRWHGEYLTRLQQRPKWAKSTKDLQVDELVLLKEDNVPPLHWHLARISELHPGSDGHVRVVTVRTAKGIYKRPITKVCRLPVNRTEELDAE